MHNKEFHGAETDFTSPKVGLWLKSLAMVLRDPVVIIILVFMFGGLLVSMAKMKYLTSSLVENSALEEAELYSKTLSTFRSLYTSEVIARVKDSGIEVTHNYLDIDNAIPLPATLTLALGSSLGDENNGFSIRLYSDNPFLMRSDGGPRDDFEVEALQALRDNPKKLYTRIETVDGIQMLRYASPDVMSQSCVDCHNTHPQSPKRDWKVGDVRGVLAINHPLSQVRTETNKGLLSTYWIVSIYTIAGFSAVIFLLSRLKRQITVSLDLSNKFAMSEARVNAIVDATADCIIVIDDNGTIVLVNNTTVDLFGWSKEELLGSNVSMLADEPHRSVHDSYLAKYKLTGVKNIIDLEREVPAVRKDGTTFSCALRVKELYHNNNQWFVGIIQDITERQKRDLKLRLALTEAAAARKQAEEANNSKSEFLANMSHEIRTPMTAIIGYTDLLLYPDSTDKSREEQVNIIQQNSQHLLQIINDILDISKIEASKLKIEFVDTSPARILAETASLMRVRAIEKEIEFDIHCTTPLPEKILTDPTRLRQILLNIVGNAIKFTDTGQVKISARVETNNGKSILFFDVSDTGIGMSTEQIENLFIPFSQADASTTRKYGGTGLGLTISKKLAKALGGEITLQSELGKGSTFTLRVDIGDLKDVKMLDITADSISSYKKSDNESTHAEITENLSGRILLAEDGKDNQKLISTFLKQAGFEVDVACNGRIAYEKAVKQEKDGDPYDLIFMDMQMPVLDGYEATRQLRKTGYSKPIVALTAHAMSDDRDNCLNAGCDDYAIKPIKRNELIAIACKYISSSAVINSDVGGQL